MNLSHFSWNELSTLYSTYTPEDDSWIRGRMDKPRGLWVSVDGPDDWAAWCTDEQFRNIEQQYRYSVTLTEDANVLQLGTYHELLEFTEQYGRELDLKLSSRFVHSIDWHRLAASYQGIIIAPYIWAARYEPETMWYNSWDVASGCLWSSEAISSFELITQPKERV